jgi:hypothetical protein
VSGDARQPSKDYVVLHALSGLTAPQLAGLAVGIQLVMMGAAFSFLILVILGVLS